MNVISGTHFRKGLTYLLVIISIKYCLKYPTLTNLRPSLQIFVMILLLIILVFIKYANFIRPTYFLELHLILFSTATE